MCTALLGSSCTGSHLSPTAFLQLHFAIKIKIIVFKVSRSCYLQKWFCMFGCNFVRPAQLNLRSLTCLLKRAKGHFLNQLLNEESDDNDDRCIYILYSSFPHAQRCTQNIALAFLTHFYASNFGMPARLSAYLMLPTTTFVIFNIYIYFYFASFTFQTSKCQQSSLHL